MARRDVELVIKAKDQAAAVVEQINEALAAFVGKQKKLGEASEKTGDVLQKLGAALGALDKQLGGMDAGRVFTGQLDTATASLGRMDAALTRTREEADRLGKELADAKTATEQYAARLAEAAAAQEQQRAALQRARADQKQLTTEYAAAVAAQKRLAAEQDKLPERVNRAGEAAQKAAARFADLTAKFEKATTPTKSLQSDLAASGRAVEKTAGKLLALETAAATIGTRMEAAGARVTHFAAAVEQTKGAITAQEKALARVGEDFAQLRAESASAAKHQTDLERAIDKATDSIARQSAQIDKAKGEYASLEAAAEGARAGVAALAARGMAPLGKALSEQRVEVLKTSQAYKAAAAEATALGARVAATTKPSTDLLTAFEQAKVKSSSLAAELLKQRQAWQQMGAVYRTAAQDLEGVRSTQARFAEIQGGLKAALDSSRVAAEKQARAIRDAATAAQTAAGGVRKLAPAQNQLAESSGRAATFADKLSQAYKEFYGDTRKSLGLLQRIRGEVLSLVAAYGGLYAVIETLKGAVSATQTLEAAQARLNVAFEGNTGKVEQEFDFLRRTAERLGLGLGDLATEYSKFQIAAKGSALTADEARKVFLQMSEAGVVNRNTTDEMKGIFTALTQIISKGVVQMEELRQQLGDRLPGAIQFMADALGVSTDEMFRMVEAGEVGADKLVALGDAVEKRFASGLPEALNGITVALGRLGTAAFEALEQFADAGFADAIVDATNQIIKTLKSADFDAFTRRMSAVFSELARAVGFAAEHFQVFVAAIAAFLGLRLTPIFVALVTHLRDTAAQAVTTAARFQAVQARAAAMGVTVTRAGYAVRTLTAAFRGLLATTGAGLAVAAISGIIAAWATEADSATEALVRHRETVDKVKNAYEKAGGAAKDWGEVLKGIGLTVQQAEDILAKLKKQFDKLASSKLGNLRIALESFGNITGGTEASRTEILKLIDAARTGAADIDGLKKRLSELADADPTLDTDGIVVPLLDAFDSLREMQTAVKEAGLTVDGFSEDADVAQQSLDELNGTVKESARTAVTMEEAYNKIDAAVASVDKLLPKLEEDTDAVAKAAQKIAEAYQDALTAARSLPDAIQRIAAEQKVARDFTVLNERLLDEAATSSLADRIIAAESVGVASARNSESSATGLGQFIKSTWLRLFKENFPDRAAGMTDAMILALREDAALSRQMVELYIKENARVLQRLGVELTDANLYLAHFLGPGGAAALIKAAPGTMASQVLGADQVAANQSVLGGKTREEVIARVQAKVGRSKAEVEIQKEQADLLREQAERQRERAQATADTIADNEFEIQQQERINAGKEREAAIESALRQAREQNPEIREEELAKIREQAGALFDLEEAQKKSNSEAGKKKDIEGEVNRLLGIQRDLREQMQNALDRGETGKAAELAGQIEGVNDQLRTAIDQAILLWEAIGGPEADAAITHLKTVKDSLRGITDNTSEYLFDFTKIGPMIIDGMAGAFDQFAKSVAEGKSVIQSAREAFLQFASDFLREIAQMILKQLIFKALTSALGPSGSAFIGLAHTGGLVGSSRAGSGNSGRRVNPAIFAGASRFHTGGMAGLRPGEIPIIAKQGEEILTRDDPRHMLNGGGAAGAKAATVNVRNINTFDAAGFLQAALDSPVGEQVLYNFISAKPERFKAALGG